MTDTSTTGNPSVRLCPMCAQPDHGSLACAAVNYAQVDWSTWRPPPAPGDGALPPDTRTGEKRLYPTVSEIREREEWEARERASHPVNRERLDGPTPAPADAPTNEEK